MRRGTRPAIITVQTLRLLLLQLLAHNAAEIFTRSQYQLGVVKSA